MMSDEELVARSRGGIRRLRQLVLRGQPIYALAYRVIGREEEARDVAQETFLRAFRALSGFKGQAKFSSWLYRITLNLCRDWIRRERLRPSCRHGRHRYRRTTGEINGSRSVDDWCRGRARTRGRQGHGALPRQRTALS
jgi:RNA polymerase sigma factor (sigma-70 family)